MFRVPKKTSIYSSHSEHDKYILGFAPELIEFIIKNQKIRTYRFGDKYDYLQVGDQVKIFDSINKKIYGTAIITLKEKTTFKDLPLDNPGHEAYRNKDHQRKVFSGYYKFLDRQIYDSDPFVIFEFKLI